MALNPNPNPRPDGTSPVERPVDEGSREGSVSNEELLNQDISATTSETRLIYTNDTGEREHVQGASFTMNGTYDNTVRFAARCYDSSDNLQFNVGGHMGTWPVFFDPPLPLEPDWKLRSFCHNTTSSSQQYNVNFIVLKSL